MKDLKGVVGDAGDLLKQVANATTEEFAATRAKLVEELGRTRSRLEAARTAVTDYAKNARHATDEHLRRNPWKALGVAAAAGVITGFFLSRR